MNIRSDVFVFLGVFFHSVLVILTVMNVSFDIASAKSLFHPTQTDIQLHL